MGEGITGAIVGIGSHQPSSEVGKAEGSSMNSEKDKSLRSSFDRMEVSKSAKPVP